jgi:zinc protease
MAAALYGPRHPYGYSELGTEAATKAMSRDDMLAFWKANFVPNNAALVVAGAISAAELKALAEENFGAWQSGQPRAAALGAPGTTKAQVVLVDMPGAAQTMLRIGNVAVPRSTPDYAPLEVMNAALGGLFSSRINMNLREEHGYTYGAGSVFRYRRSNGPFFIYTSVRTDVTGAAVKEIFKEVDRMVAVPLTAEELALSKDSLVRSLPGQFETSSQALASFADTYVYGLGLDYFARLPSLINAVDVPTVQDVAKRHLAPSRMVTVAVGDRAQIEPQLRDEAGLKSIERRDPDGKPL